jgi:hypothetical protein
MNMSNERLGKSEELSWQTRQERTKLYESVIPIEVANEIPSEEYLRGLTQQDRINLARLFMSFDRLVRVMPGLTALAVGSSTFNERYWADLQGYLAVNDPTKLDYVCRRGEDIDIILCEDAYRELPPSWLTECVDFVKMDLKDAGFDYTYEEIVRESGTSYLTVPEEYKEQEGQGVIRHKAQQYPADSFKIAFSNGRSIHLSFERMLAELKLKNERINDYNFSLLFRGSSKRWDLIRTLEQINSSE